MCNDNFQDIFEFTKYITNYIKELKVKDKDTFVPTLDSNRKTGFLGCLQSTINLHSRLIKSGELDHIRMYKISQDHLELFFGTIRSLGGFNNNPTSRQFNSIGLPKVGCSYT